MKLSIAALSLFSVPARAAYPDELIWSGNAATLEFCNSGSAYGYNKPDTSSSACDAFTPGPLIRMQPGNTYTLTLQNAASDSAVRTNVHTHGLHIVGSGNGDNVLRSVEGGSCLDYVWDLPADHPPGTYW